MLISVIMPLYNKSNYVKEAINSILRQTYKDFEIIVVDDCSTDDSVKKVKEIKDNRIKLIELDKNMGVSYAANIGIKNSRGYYVVRMDADDISRFDRIEKLIKFAQKENADLVGSQFDIFSDVDIPKGLYRFMHYSNKIIKSDEIIDNFTVMMPVSQPTFCIKKEIFEEGFYYNESLSTAEDYEFLGRLLINNKNVYKIPEKLVSYRYINTSLSNSTSLKTTINSIKIKLNFIYEYYKLKEKETKNVFIWGTKKFAQYLFEELQDPKYKTSVRAFTDFNSQEWGKTIRGIPVISPDEMILNLKSNDIVITIWNLEREKIINYLDNKGLKKNLNYFVFS